MALWGEQNNRYYCSGGYSPRFRSAHRTCAPRGPDTCGEPNEIESTIRVLTGCFAAPLRGAKRNRIDRHSQVIIPCFHSRIIPCFHSRIIIPYFRRPDPEHGCGSNSHEVDYTWLEYVTQRNNF